MNHSYITTTTTASDVNQEREQLARIAAKHSRAKRLLALCQSSESPMVQMIAMRMLCRSYYLDKQHATEEVKALHKKLDRISADDLAARYAKEILAERIQGFRKLASCRHEALLQLGRAIISICPYWSHVIGFERLCDLLNVNHTHRKKAKEDGYTTLTGLAFVARLEDSAEFQRTSDWEKWGPLYTACFYAAAEFIKTTPQDLFENIWSSSELGKPAKLH